MSEQTRLRPRDLPSLFRATGDGADGFWRSIADSLEEAVLVVGADRRVIYGNRAAQLLMDAPMAEVRGRLCVDAIACPQCECMCRLFEQGGVSDIEVEIYVAGRKEPRTYRKNAHLLRCSDGEVIGGVEVLTDITTEVEDRGEKQRRAELLFQEKRRNHVLLQNVCEGVVSLDARGTIREISDQMSRLTGYQASDLVGRSLSAVCMTEAPLDAGNPPDGPVAAEVQCRDGSVRAVTATILPMRYGADELLCVVRDATQPPPHDRARDIQRSFGFYGMVSRSPMMHELFRLIDNAADSDANVIIEGESGTGKELVARALHQASARRRDPFFAVNCATFTGGLLLSELFGHERGAFTGAVKTQRGKLELAASGTLLLDEVAEIPLQHQSLLLRVLETRRFERLGGHQSIELDARIVAATNIRLREAVQRHAFREDLYYRLNVLPIRVPPLRERPEDIELLAQYFLDGAACDGGSSAAIADDTMAVLRSHDWPGNVRELSNVMDYAAFRARGQRIEPRHLPEDFGRRESALPVRPAFGASDDTHQTEEHTAILEALDACHYRRGDTARRLGIDRSTLWRRMKRLGIRGV